MLRQPRRRRSRRKALNCFCLTPGVLRRRRTGKGLTGAEPIFGSRRKSFVLFFRQKFRYFHLNGKSVFLLPELEKAPSARLPRLSLPTQRTRQGLGCRTLLTAPRRDVLSPGWHQTLHASHAFPGVTPPKRIESRPCTAMAFLNRSAYLSLKKYFGGGTCVTDAELLTDLWR